MGVAIILLEILLVNTALDSDILVGWLFAFQCLVILLKPAMLSGMSRSFRSVFSSCVPYLRRNGNARDVFRDDTITGDELRVRRLYVDPVVLPGSRLIVEFGPLADNNNTTETWRETFRLKSSSEREMERKYSECERNQVVNISGNPEYGVFNQNENIGEQSKENYFKEFNISTIFDTIFLFVSHHRPSVIYSLLCERHLTDLFLFLLIIKLKRPQIHSLSFRH